MKVFLSLLVLVGAFYPMSSLGETHEMQKPIQIQGTFQRRLTPDEKRKIQRKRLEKRTEALVQKQIETLRLRQEIELTKKLRRLEKRIEQKLDNDLENI
ncbi:MAG: hypothetical protein NXH75_14210 [Halobacteriovoraceae bacterium]|nr:hypothetical protein [Halobacteriovoraceae bacterium]